MSGDALHRVCIAALANNNNKTGKDLEATESQVHI
jgi:hypothetical protein